MLLPKSLQRYAAKIQGIDDMRANGDGYWVYLNRGWTSEPMVHQIHENSPSACARVMPYLQRCDCAYCRGEEELMARISINGICNVVTGDDSEAYRSPAPGFRVQPQITIPRYRARLYVSEAKSLIAALMKAVEVAEQQTGETK